MTENSITEKEFIKGSLWLYIAAIVTFGAGLLTTIFLARLLDAELYGIFSVCVAVAGLLATFSDLGLNASAQYFVAFFSAKGDRAKVVSYISILFKYKIILIAIVCSIMYIFSGFFAQIFHSPESVQYFEIAVLYLAFSSSVSFMGTILNGLRRFKMVALTSMLLNLLKLVIAPLLVFYGFGVSGALLGFVLAVGINSFILYILIKGFISFKHRKIDLKDSLSYSFYSGISGLSGMILAWTDSIMLGLFMLPIFVGYYRIALTLSWAVSGLITAGIRNILMPSMIPMEAVGDRIRLKRYFDESVKYGMFISIPAVFGLAVIAKPLISLLFGYSYQSSIPALIILSYFCVGSMMLAIFSSTFGALKQPKMIAKIFIIMAILNVILNALLIPMYGIVGASIATVTTWVLGLTIVAFLLKRKFDITFHVVHIFKPLIASVIMFLVIYPLFYAVDDILVGVILIAIAVIIYIIIMYLLRFPVKIFFKKIIGAINGS